MEPSMGFTQYDDWAATYNVLCNCGRKKIQIYYCNVETCPDREQKFFCLECVTEDLKHHHKKVSIKQELDSKMEQWKSLVSNLRQLKHITDNNYPQYEHLIKYLDNENLLKTDFSVKSPAHNVS